jgi:hypothetical protein
MVRELLVPGRLVGEAVRELAVDIRRIGMRREAVVEPHLGGDRRLAEARRVLLRTLDPHYGAALGPRQGERGDERQAGVLTRDRQLDQLEQGRHTIE